MKISAISAAAARDVRERGQDDRSRFERSRHASEARQKAVTMAGLRKRQPFNAFGELDLTASSTKSSPKVTLGLPSGSRSGLTCARSSSAGKMLSRQCAR